MIFETENRCWYDQKRKPVSIYSRKNKKTRHRKTHNIRPRFNAGLRQHTVQAWSYRPPEHLIVVAGF